MRASSRQFASALVVMMVAALSGPAFAQVCTPAGPCGDINDSGTVTAGDALGVLENAIGLNIPLTCACNGGDQCQDGGVTETGQTMCWDPLDLALPIDPIDCVGTGQDGEFRSGLPLEFVDNGDGTISDVHTKLMWEKLSDDGSIHDWDNFSYQWAGAFGKVSDLNAANFAGYGDWRLPQARELSTLVDFSASSPAVRTAFNKDCKPGCSVITCSCTKSSFYWSSTTVQAGPTTAWSVLFLNGSLTTALKTSYNYVRAVRGGL